MSQELLAIIEQLEREKGIKKEVLIEAVESALLSAAKKVVDVKPGEEIKVQLDPESGKIHAFKNEKEITSIDFGRIATSTARQVIIQKIREAEKDVVFNDFQGKLGDITTGTVYRFDKGNIIVDLLGKTEGIIFKREQSPGENFRQGDRIRAYVMEVKRDSRGIQILLSRTHPNFVKKLFELEIPEIYEGIVEIKSIAREAGGRTKISVWSKNEKVDAVGACVGMRGNRIRNIVNELQAEKIDIVRYNEDLREYIKAALSPAQIAEIKLDKENKHALVVVEDDQLSLAIGKHGQNVRLASRLIGWELDIRTKTALAKAEAEALLSPKVKEEAKPKETLPAERKEEEKKEVKKLRKRAKKEAISLIELKGVGEKTLTSLHAAGFKNLEDIAQAKIADIVKVKGIAEKKAEKLIAQAKKLVHK